MFENQYWAYKPRPWFAWWGGITRSVLNEIIKKEEEERTGLNISQILRFIIVDMNKAEYMPKLLLKVYDIYYNLISFLSILLTPLVTATFHLT